MPAARRSHQARAVVTGTGSGIGRAFVREIVRRGGCVVCSDVSLASARATAASIAAEGGIAHPLVCDVTDLAQVEALAETSRELLDGPVDLVINNAGVGAGGQRIGEAPVADWQWTLKVNLWGVIHGCHVFAPKLRAQGRGGIINVASAASFSAAPLMGPYNVSKAGVLALSETLAAECAGSGVRVSVLCPTFVATAILEAGRIAPESARFADRLMQRFGTAPELIARRSLDALDRGRLYALPQIDARALWRLKRYAPVLFGRASALLGQRLSRSAAGKAGANPAISKGARHAA